MKKKLNKKILFLLICFSFIKEIFSATTANFLKIAIGARNVAMGETGAANEDINSVYWNPAGLANVNKKEISFMHTVWFETISYEHIAFVLPTEYNDKIAISLDYLFMSEMEKYDNIGVLQPEKMSAYDLALTVSYAGSLQNYIKYPIDFGYNLKIINSKLEEEQATTVAIDFGLKSYFKLKFIEEKIDFGFVIQNLGVPMIFIKEASLLPTNIKLGFRNSFVLFKENSLVWNLDLNFPLEGDFRLCFGLEYNFKNSLFKDKPEIIFSPRIGWGAYNKGFDGGLKGITAGFGIYNPTVPRGGIIMYSGPWHFDSTGLGTGPLEGWALCNGLNGTPNLTNRFVMGCTYFAVLNSTGGANSYNLTVDQLPSHTHSIASDTHAHSVTLKMLYSCWEYDHSLRCCSAGSTSNVTTVYNTSSYTHSHGGATGATGGGQPIDNRPAYVVLAFIMKL